ncbi:hypothetical protein CAPTEDRAFT_117593 [Capitella teleta]|uniref:G-protein coupled receptors family 1 profile domain-containing protein n=1 Tax=Capitella teleta TaxID=283909 RepID=R7THF9_CAPTE|nr:hypothetical protein CAPTEDRAFT_117593 [Capitella teleta]|eukprot:ELT93154.1 hypothetical protein CAPTEDRAFT_117593 [Capitella teleta]
MCLSLTVLITHQLFVPLTHCANNTSVVCASHSSQYALYSLIILNSLALKLFGV